MYPIRVVINGAAGRMGQRLVALAAGDADLRIVATLESPAHPRLGDDAGTLAGTAPLQVPLTSGLEVSADVVIDFSTPEGTERIIGACLDARVPLVVATTGLSAGQQSRLRDAARDIAILWAPSMSLAVNLGMHLAEVAAAALADHPSGADVEIVERHHRFKEDAPSGTALKFGEIISRVMGQSQQRHGREGRPGKRPHDEIGYHALRVGDNPGEHTIVFGLLGETLEISVKATSRDCYAHGALAAAKFLAGKPPGLYGMNDVIRLRSDE